MTKYINTKIAGLFMDQNIPTIKSRLFRLIIFLHVHFLVFFF